MNTIQPGGARQLGGTGTGRTPPSRTSNGRASSSRRLAAWSAASLLIGGGLAGASLLAGAPAALADPGPDCAAPVISGPTATVTCGYTGASQYWTVPAGVTQATFTVYGAEGAGYSGTPGSPGSGGLGAEVTGALPVTSGAVLQVNAGQAGAWGAGGTFGGGGAPAGFPDTTIDGIYYPAVWAYGGGGESDVRAQAADGSYPLADALLVAGGGGGAGSWGFTDGGGGGNADTAGDTAQAYTQYCNAAAGGYGGGAGTATVGGAGGAGGRFASDYNPAACVGASEYGSSGTAGTLGVGGAGGTNGDMNSDPDLRNPALTLNLASADGFGGGGGGGYYGGGGGGGAAFDEVNVTGSGGGGGGGGSSYTGNVAGATVTDGVAAPDDGPNGEVVITYQVVPIAVTVAGSQVYGSGTPQFTPSDTPPSGVTVSGSVTCSTVNGGTPIAASLDASGSYTIDSSSCSGLSVPSGYAVTYTGGAFTVSPASQTVSFTALATGTDGQSAALTATGGGSGNPVTFSVDASSGSGVCTVSDDTVSYTAAGTCVIDANQAGDADYTAAPQVQQTIAVQQAPAFTADAPPLTAGTGSAYSYQFAASGTPAPSFALTGAPSWLSVNVSTGLVTGTPPAGTTSFSYAVTASNAAGSVTTSTFTVAMTSDADIEARLSCPAGLTVGHSGTCTLTVTNNGPALATSVYAGATAAPGLTLTGCSNGCSELLGAVGWSLGSLPAGQSDVLTIDVTANRAGTPVVTAADGSLTTPDPNLANNVATANVTITK
jgi:hypothetical protein